MEGERLCVFCEHWEFYGGSPGYTLNTPGNDASMGCKKGVYPDMTYGELELVNLHENEFRALILTARTCPHYSRDCGPELERAETPFGIRWVPS